MLVALLQQSESVRHPAPGGFHYVVDTKHIVASLFVRGFHEAFSDAGRAVPTGLKKKNFDYEQDKLKLQLIRSLFEVVWVAL